MNTKQEILDRLKEVLETERLAAQKYDEMTNGLGNSKMKRFFKVMRTEEERHERIVEELMDIIRDSS
jgi:rubrerythrin